MKNGSWYVIIGPTALSFYVKDECSSEKWEKRPSNFHIMALNLLLASMKTSLAVTSDAISCSFTLGISLV